MDNRLPAEGLNGPLPDTAQKFVQLAQLIAELGAMGTRDTDFHSSLKAICDSGRSILGADAACVVVIERGYLHVSAACGYRAAEIQGGYLTDQELGTAAVRVVRSLRSDSEGCQEETTGLFAGCAVLAEPVVVMGRAVGILLFARRDCHDEFSTVEIAQGATLARQAAFAYGMIRRAGELELIYEVTRAINSSLELEQVLELIYQGISRILPTDNAYVALVDGDEIRFEIEVESCQRLPKRRRQRGAGLTEYLLQTRRPLLIADNFEDSCRRLGIRYSGRPARCWMGVPMVFRDKAVGVIALQSYERSNVFDPEHLSVLENIGGQAAVAIENARLYQQTRSSLEQLQTTQQLLLQSEKLAAVGQLISGIAHELNNPLTGVVGWTQFLMSQRLEAHVERHLKTINEQAQRAARIVQNLLTFSRQHKPEQKLASINDIVESTLALRAYELRVNNIAVHRRYDPGLPAISVDPHQIQQVVLNLIINAEQAILSVRNSGAIIVTTEVAGAFVRIAVADDGPGIPADKLKQIFNPFFTTKAIGQGTGLGLSISFGIVQEHAGRIYAENGEGCGARLVLDLPLIVSVADRQATGEPAPAGRPAARRKILVVDDEESVRELLIAVLENSQFTIDTAATGEEALRKALAATYDLIITDLKMPGLSGAQFCEKLRAAKPDAPRFLFITGDVLSTETQKLLETTGSLCMLKPFDIEEASRVVMRALAESPTRSSAASAGLTRAEAREHGQSA